MKLTLVVLFQSTHPSWGATLDSGVQNLDSAISIHAPIVGCDVEYADWLGVKVISIHAPIVGCDYILCMRMSTLFFISIHAPIVGCDCIPLTAPSKTLVFQSTHPSWGATKRIKFWRLQVLYFNPRTHRGVRHRYYKEYVERLEISIHAPIVGCDKKSCKLIKIK